MEYRRYLLLGWNFIYFKSFEEMNGETKLLDNQMV